MNVLWAPWRMEYIGGPRAAGCIFCPDPAADRRASLILRETDHALVMLNKYPFASGHLLIAPRRHAAEPAGLEAAEYAAVMEMVRTGIRILREEYKPEGLNVGMNLGRAAGAGIEEHMHWHIVPRWNGDTNFMPMLADTRVMPEHLERTWERLQPHFAAQK